MSAASWAMGIGALVGLAGILGTTIPAKVRRFLLEFPRGRTAGVVLSVVALAWAARLLFRMPMGMFEYAKPLLYVLTPVVMVLVVLFMDELLAPRALGGLLAIVPAPLLDVVRWHPSSWRLVLVVTAYLAVVAGCILMLSPFVFRRLFAPVVTADSRVRMTGMVLLALAVGYGALSLIL